MPLIVTERCVMMKSDRLGRLGNFSLYARKVWENFTMCTNIFSSYERIVSVSC